MQGYTAKNILEGLKDKDTRVLDYIYENYFYQVKVFITRNHGTVEDARDIYQDALLVIYQKSRQNNLALSCSFNTYLYSVCRLLWLKQLEQKKLERMTTEDTGMFVELDDSIISLSEANERYKLYQEHFRRLSFSCQKVMNSSWQG